ncbi:MAG: SDR family oxidoreductase [Sphingomonadaceae bacterium]|nr:SDR family oxidoreductase [Sphingomonadaceae bacterium]
MLRDMEGKVALVTGASEGIGLATAMLLARRGAMVAICGRNPERLANAKAELDAVGTCEAHRLDVSDTDALEALIAGIAERHGRLDMLVNNAMSNNYGAIADITLAKWRKDFAVNADAVFVATKAAMKVMAGQGSGSIVNIASTNGLRAAARLSSYSASKAAMVHFTSVAAMEGAQIGVRVNCVAPGMVLTRATEDYMRYSGETALRTVEAIPMARGGRPEELAEPIAFLLSDAASYITGITLPVDGGKSVQLYLPA